MLKSTTIGKKWLVILAVFLLVPVRGIHDNSSDSPGQHVDSHDGKYLSEDSRDT